LGILGPDGHYFAKERASGIGYVTVQVGWDNAEPLAGHFDKAYINGEQAEVATARRSGLQVVLDPGLQYAPGWVFALPGGTHFIDQYGDVFNGDQFSGDTVANAVTDMAVRAAQRTYLSWLGRQFPAGTLAAVRVGGGPLGELRYPAGYKNVPPDCFWAYDASSQAISPVPGWRPGSGTPEQATSFLNWYNANLVGYGDWLDGAVSRDFRTEELLMLPGWGERPGVAAPEESSLLTLGDEEFSEGLDWADLLASLPDPVTTVAYTTYLDSPLGRPTLQLEDPADYIASLARPLGIATGGENTGNGTVANLQLLVVQALRLHMVIVDWMGEAQAVASTDGADPSGPSFADLSTAARELSS
jgi:hypothetical protein